MRVFGPSGNAPSRHSIFWGSGMSAGVLAAKALAVISERRIAAVWYLI
jgi:hypothetical protein